MITLNPKYQQLFKLPDHVRYVVITGGRGSGKSFGEKTWEVLTSFESGHKILDMRYTMNSAKDSIIPEFQEKLQLLDIEHTFTVTNNGAINNISGTEFLFRGIKTSSGDQTAKLKSLQGITVGVLEEAEELTREDVFDKIDLSIRSKEKPNRFILILNPATKEHWIYKRFFEARGVEGGFNGIKDNVCYIHTTYLDNAPNLPPSFLDQVERLKIENPTKYNHVVMGGWLDRAEGVVFENWEFGEFNPDNLQTSCGLDFGFSVDPDALTEVAIDKSKRIIYVKEQYYERGTPTTQLGQIIKSRIGNKLIIADSASPRTIDDLKILGLNIKAVKKGTIESGINRMLDYKIVVDPSSQNIAKELNNYVYTDKKSSMYIDDWNHAIDGIRYNIIYHLDNPNKGVYDIF